MTDREIRIEEICCEIDGTDWSQFSAVEAGYIAGMNARLPSLEQIEAALLKAGTNWIADRVDRKKYNDKHLRYEAEMILEMLKEMP